MIEDAAPLASGRESMLKMSSDEEVEAAAPTAEEEEDFYRLVDKIRTPDYERRAEQYDDSITDPNMNFIAKDKNSRSLYDLRPVYVPPVTRLDKIKSLASTFSESELFDMGSSFFTNDDKEIDYEQLKLAALNYEAIVMLALENQTTKYIYVSKSFSFLCEIYAMIDDWLAVHNTAVKFRTLFGLSLVSSHCTLAFALMMLGQNKEGISAATEGLRIFPDAEVLYSVRGDCYYAAGKFKLACGDFNRAYELSRKAHNRAACKESFKVWLSKKREPKDIMIRNTSPERKTRK